MSGESNIERDRRKRSLIDTPAHPLKSAIPGLPVGSEVTDEMILELPVEVLDQLSAPLQRRYQALADGEIITSPDEMMMEFTPTGGDDRYRIIFGGSNFDTSDDPLEDSLGNPMMCSGCGSTDTIRTIRRRHPSARSCCPERKLVLREFRTRPGKLKPGSLTADGSVVDHRGEVRHLGPCFIPFDISPARKGKLGEAGWCIEHRAAHWPSILPFQGAACIVRTEPSNRP